MNSFISRVVFVGVLTLLAWMPHTLHAATLRVSPDTGVYVQGATFNVTVVLNTAGKPVNAADAELAFNPRELSVVSVSKGTLFSLWTLEPTFSNSAGTISFGGGSPQGYTGSNGSVMTVTFRSLGAGAPKVSFKSGSVLAADGLGTNVLTGMTGGAYSIEAKSTTPPPEYVPPVNTPGAPVLTSDTHPSQDHWYREKTARISWKNPTGVTEVRTLLDESPLTTPTKVYETPISDRELTDLPEGVSYFHVQLRNADGWGRVAHYRLNIDSEEPRAFTITDVTEEALQTARTFKFDVTDTSPIREYRIQLDGKDIPPFTDPEGTGVYTTEALLPGTHNLVVEAVDSAGNSRVATHSFEVSALPSPSLVNPPTRLTEGFIPAFKGESVPGAIVTAELEKDGTILETIVVTADDAGSFTLVPEHGFEAGVYEIVLVAELPYGARSVPSEPIRIVVELPGYITFATRIVQALSVIVPLVALILMLVVGTWYLWHTFKRWKRSVLGEAIDAEHKLKIEFDGLITRIHARLGEIRETRKTKLTRGEEALFSSLEDELRETQVRLKKEITDIETIVK